MTLHGGREMFKTKNLLHLIVLLGLGLNVGCLFSDEEIQSFNDCADRRAGDNDGVLTADHFLFVTATDQNGNLGGLSGADATCQAEADTAGLERCYKAVLGDTNSSAAARLIDNGGALKSEAAVGKAGTLATEEVETSLTLFVTPVAGLTRAPDTEIDGQGLSSPQHSKSGVSRDTQAVSRLF